MKLMGQSKRIVSVEEMISAQFGILDEDEVERMQTGLGISMNQNWHRGRCFSETSRWFGGVIIGKECRVVM